jgi:CrcB protein
VDAYDEVIDPDVDGRASDRAREPGRRQWDLLLAVAAGGVVGALARYQLDQLIAPTGGGFPVSTLIVNVSGSLVIGALMVLLLELTSPHRLARPFLSTGLLGGYTTFSTFAVQTEQLLAAQQPVRALVYVVSSVVLCLAAVWASSALMLAIGHAVIGRRTRRRQRARTERR